MHRRRGGAGIVVESVVRAQRHGEGAVVGADDRGVGLGGAVEVALGTRVDVRSGGDAPLQGRWSVVVAGAAVQVDEGAFEPARVRSGADRGWVVRWQAR